MTTEAAALRQPVCRAFGYGELIRAHRVYMGISQRTMADKLGIQRRNYQRIENSQDMCPAGLLTQVEELTDQFDTQVDTVMNEATRLPGLTISTSADPQWDWERNVAGRAAMLASGSPEKYARITLADPERN